MAGAAEHSALTGAILKGTATNYLRVAVKLVKTVMLTRILQYHLGVDFYGYWTLLWAVFGYAMLLELGFGRTMQKYTAEGVDTPERLLSFNRIFSAVLASYLGIALALLAISALLAVNLESIFRLPEGNTGYYRTVFWVFGIGCAVVFPTGICTEILAGMHKIHWRNWVIILNQLLELAGIWLTFRLGGSLLAIAVFTCANNLFSNIVMAAAIRRRIPGIRFTFSGLSIATFRRIADFSVFSYLMSIAALVIFRTDRVVLGACSGIAAVAVYQFGTRIPELFQYFTGQLTETMGPTASRLYLRGEHEELRRYMLIASKVNVFLGAGALVGAGFLAAPILKAWLDLDSAEVLNITYVMLFSGFLSVAFRDTANVFMQMSGRHRIIAVSVIFEAVFNLGLSLALVFRYHAFGVAIGTLIPNALLALFVMFPLAAGHMKLGLWEYFTRVYLPVIPAALLTALALWGFRHFISEWNWPLILTAAAVAGILYPAAAGMLLFTAAERRALLDRCRSLAAR